MNTQLDRLQHQVVDNLRVDDPALDCLGYADQSLSQEITYLQNVVRSLSVTSETQDLLQPDKLVNLISDVSHRLLGGHENAPAILTAHKSDLIWLAIAKAAVQTLGLILNSSVEQAQVFSDEVRYWDDILASSWYTGLHVVQTFPLRMWQGARDPYFYKMTRGARNRQPPFTLARWTQFYDFVRQCFHAQPVHDMRTKVLSHFAACRSEIQQKQKILQTMKDLHATSIGLLTKECLSFDTGDGTLLSSNGAYKALGNQWRYTVLRSVILMESIINNTADTGDFADFEHRVFIASNAEECSAQSQLDNGPISAVPVTLIERLVHILKDLLPTHSASSKAVARKCGHPSYLVRYWLPFSLVVFSASTSLKILVDKRTEIVGWAVNIGTTAIDFFSNWVVDPVQRLMGTIRHDKDSEIAIMSKNSLEADRASLERMVVDFVWDHRASMQGESAATDTSTIANSVKEGDLTPVLKAYERDLRSPFVGTIRGDLIRALLIQIQKTKVDVEIAMSGINSLLKSQELVFGYVLPLAIHE